jgi:serine/threonine-protein kinase
MPPSTSPALCALCRRSHDPERPCSTEAGLELGRLGEVLGERYELSRLLGAGGMGVVYEARHTVIGRRFAVKLLHPQHARQPAMLTRFQREARAAGSLENDHIAAAVDFGFAADGAPYLVMEQLEGEDLAALIAREGPQPVRRAVSLVVQACRGLAAAHARDIVHRDLKPANLFLTRRADGADLVKVLDFGIAKLLDADDTGASITGTGKLLGTASYMPPEQARGDGDLDHRIDVYALGAILYELLAGMRAHPGTSYNAVLFHILTQRPDPLGLRRPDVPAGLQRVIERAMAPDRAERHQSVTTLLEALSPFASAGDTRAPAASPPPPAAPAPVDGRAETAAASLTGEPPAQPAGPPSGRTRRARQPVALGLAALGLLAGGFAIAHRARPLAAPAPAPGPAPAPTAAAVHAPAAPPNAAVTETPAPPARVPDAPPPPRPARRAPAPARERAAGAAARARAARDFDTRNPYDESP